MVVVGGSGITYGLACLYSVLDAAKVNRSAVRKFNFIWMLRSRGQFPSIYSYQNTDIFADHYQWIKKDLECHLAAVPPHMDITFNFHVTQYSPIEGTLLEKVATLTRAAPPATADTSSSEGYNSSSPAESINEKERDSDDKFRGEDSKEGFVLWHQGRADLENVVRQAVEQAQGPVSVNGESRKRLETTATHTSSTVCGPSTLQNAVRTAVRKTTSPAKVLKEGQAPVEFHCENFGW